MDISDTESDDYDDVEATDDEWVESGKLRGRKRKSKSRRSSTENISSSEDDKENSRDRLGGTSGETASDICCSCSKTSSCKTTKCKCKAMGSSCGSSCGCLATKCANRASISNESQEPTHSGLVETDKERLLATQGAELLRGALADIDQRPRKALSDIGNTVVRVSPPLKCQVLNTQIKRKKVKFSL